MGSHADLLLIALLCIAHPVLNRAQSGTCLAGDDQSCLATAAAADTAIAPQQQQQQQAPSAPAADARLHGDSLHAAGGASMHAPSDAASPSEDLEQLRALLVSARQAVAELSAAVQRQERKLHELYGIQMEPMPRLGDRVSFHPSSPAAPPLGLLSHFHPLAKVHVTPGASASVVHAFNQPPDDKAGWELPRYVAIGDTAGAVRFFDAHGRLLVEYATGSSSTVTAMASYALRRNESVLVTGHEDGEVRMHGVYEVFNRSIARMSITTVYLHHVLPPGVGPTNETSGFRVESTPAPIAHMLGYRALGKQGGRRQVVIVDANGWLRIQRDDGTVKYAAHMGGPQLAVQLSGDQLVSLSSTQALLVRTSLTASPRALNCAGINGSSLVAAVFDPARQYRGYALTEAGELLALVVPHAARSTVCKVTKRMPLGLEPWPPSSPPLLAALRGHLLLYQQRLIGGGGEPSAAEAAEAGAVEQLPGSFHLINVTSVVKEGAPEAARMDGTELANALGIALAQGSELRPILSVVGRSDLVTATLGGGELAFLQSHLPVPRGMEGKPQSRGWTQLIFMGLMGIVAVFQFSKARSRRHDGWGNSAFRGRDTPLQAALGAALRGEGQGGAGGGGGGGHNAAARLAAYNAALAEADRAAAGAYPTRAMRRAARMAPVSTRLHGDRPDAIVEGDEDEEDVQDQDGGEEEDDYE